MYVYIIKLYIYIYVDPSPRPNAEDTNQGNQVIPWPGPLGTVAMFWWHPMAGKEEPKQTK